MRSHYKVYPLNSSNLLLSLAQFWYDHLESLKNEALGRIIRVGGNFYFVYSIQGTHGGKNKKDEILKFAEKFFKKKRDELVLITDVHSHPRNPHQSADAIHADNYPSHADMLWEPRFASILLTPKYILLYNMKEDQKDHNAAIRFHHEKKGGRVTIRNKDSFVVFYKKNIIKSGRERKKDHLYDLKVNIGYRSGQIEVIKRTFSSFEKLKGNLYIRHNYELIYQPKVSDSDVRSLLFELMWVDLFPFLLPAYAEPSLLPNLPLLPPSITSPQAPAGGARPKGSPSPTDGSGLPPGGGGGVSGPSAEPSGASSTRSSGPHYPDDFGGAATATWGQGGVEAGSGAGGSLGSEGLASPSASPTDTAGEGAAWENPDAPEGSGSSTPSAGGGQGGGSSRGAPSYDSKFTSLEEKPLQRPGDAYMDRPPWRDPFWNTLPEEEKRQLLKEYDKRLEAVEKAREDDNKSPEQGGEPKAESSSSGRGTEPTTSESRNPLVAGLLSWALSFSPSSSRGFDRSGEIAGESRTPHGDFWEVWVRQVPKFEERSQGEPQGFLASGGGGGGYPDEVAYLVRAESAWKNVPVVEAAPGEVTDVTKDPTNETGPPPPTDEGGEEKNPDGSPIWTTSQDSGPRPSGFSLRGFSRLAPWIQPLPADGSSPDEGWSGADNTATIEGRRTPLVDPTLPKRSLSKEEKDEAFRLLLENPRARHASRPNTASATSSKTTSASHPRPSAYRLPDEF